MARGVKELVWYVMAYKNGRVGPYNIFDHGTYTHYVSELIKKKPTKEELGKGLESETRYCFWGKVEHEITISEYPPYMTKNDIETLLDEGDKYKRQNGRYPYRQSPKIENSIKVDIYAQVKLNWDVFVDYIWRSIQ